MSEPVISAEPATDEQERSAPPPAQRLAPTSPADGPADAPQEPVHHTRVVAIANQKGGVGKTTTVVNLAAGLGELGQRVLVVDLDPQSNSTSGLGLHQHPGSSLYKPLLGQGEALAMIQATEVPGVDVIPSELDLAGAEVDIARADGYLHCFKKAITPVVQSRHYDYVLVDCPPALGILTMNALTAAHSMIVPMQCEYYALEGLSVITRLIGQLRDSGANTDLEIEGILMTMYDGRVNLSTEVVKEVSRHFGDKVYSTVIPRNVRLSEAPSFGKPVIVYDKESTGSRAYRALAIEFLKRRGVAVDESRMESTAARKIPILRIHMIQAKGEQTP